VSDKNTYEESTDFVASYEKKPLKNEHIDTEDLVIYAWYRGHKDTESPLQQAMRSNRFSWLFLVFGKITYPIRNCHNLKNPYTINCSIKMGSYTKDVKDKNSHI
jgi:hypothetical protein